MEPPILAIDIGTNFISALVCSAGGGKPRVLGAAILPSAGVDKGLIVDVQAAAAVISEASASAAQNAGLSVGRAYVAVAGGHTTGIVSSGNVTVIAADKVVTEADRLAAIDDAVRKAELEADEEVVHALPFEFAVDRGAVATDPVGLSATVLEAKVNIAAGLNTALANVKEVVHRAGLESAGIVLKPIAAAWGAVGETRRNSTVHLDIGGGTTSLTVFREGFVRHTCLLPVGGNHITRDIALGLKLTIGQAEEAKIEFGSALGDEIDDMEFITLSAAEEDKVVSRRYVCQIIEARLEEIFSYMKNEMTKLDFIPERIILTGGSSAIQAIDGLAAEVLKIPAEVGGPLVLEGLSDETAAGIGPGAFGLVRYVLEPHAEGFGPSSPPPTLAVSVMNRVKDWLGGNDGKRPL
ncbi:MAG: cell division protein FtsA [Candidatus Aquicultorales bacterium]